MSERVCKECGDKAKWLVYNSAGGSEPLCKRHANPEWMAYRVYLGTDFPPGRRAY